MHSQGIIPRVLLNGLGIPKALQYNDCTIHKKQDCTRVCDKMAQLYGDITYKGQSLAGFAAMVFDDMCRPRRRPTMQATTRDEVMEMTSGLCVHCGALAEEIDHRIPKGAGGSDDVDNQCAVCKVCHKQKSATDLHRVGVEDLNVYFQIQR